MSLLLPIPPSFFNNYEKEGLETSSLLNFLGMGGETRTHFLFKTDIA